MICYRYCKSHQLEDTEASIRGLLYQAPANIRTHCEFELTKASIALESSAKHIHASKTAIMDLKNNLFGARGGRAPPSAGYGQRPPQPPPRNDPPYRDNPPSMPNRDPGGYSVPMPSPGRQPMPQRTPVGRSQERRVTMTLKKIADKKQSDLYVYRDL